MTRKKHAAELRFAGCQLIDLGPRPTRGSLTRNKEKSYVNGSWRLEQWAKIGNQHDAAD
jgi:hypothetical protein